MRTLKEIEEKPKLSDVKDLLAEVRRLTMDHTDARIYQDRIAVMMEDENRAVKEMIAATEDRDRLRVDLADMTADRDRLHSELTKLRCMGCARPRRWRFLRNEAAGK